jgi:ABC-2 type transport system ATP-binding protein
MLAEVAQTVDEVVILASGRAVHQGALDELAQFEENLEDAFFQLTSDAMQRRGLYSGAAVSQRPTRLPSLSLK